MGSDAAVELPIHFFTIVLNGEPFIRHHLEIFRQLPFRWHWHIVEGVAALTHDTAWSLANGGRIDAACHSGGMSNDGTREYLDTLARDHPGQVTVYRKPGGAFWNGKLEMVNAPLANIQEPCLLWQVDADELWTYSQLVRTRLLFLLHPDRHAALIYCHYFVGAKLAVTTRDTYGNYSSEWLRVWRYQPGDEGDTSVVGWQVMALTSGGLFVIGTLLVLKFMPSRTTNRASESAAAEKASE